MANTQDVTPRNDAPRALSVYPAWSCAKKDAIGKALGTSRLWFTLAQGIVTEVYFPRPDIPQLKDLGFIIADNAGFWVELRRMNQYSVSWHEDVIPAITLTHRHERFTFTLRICVDPDRDVLLLDFSLEGEPGLYPYVLAAPRLGENATSNLALAADWEGHPTLWVEQGPFGLALMATNRQNRTAFMERSVGEVGVSDGWQDFNQNGRMNWHYAKAGPSDVALTAKLSRSGTLALGLGSSKEAAATLALQSLAAGFESRWTGYTQSWKSWLDGIHLPALLQKLDKASRLLIFRSAVVIKSHEDATFPGACVASLSVPWGESSVSRGGYHLVWSRDLVETAGALIALGCLNEARRILLYLMATQQANGHWLQNQWLGGKPFWQGIQLDETAFPVLLASALAEQDALEGIDVTHMTRQALRFIAQEGPTTSQDRWEEDAGINTFTLAAAISALVEGSRFLKGKEAECALMLADSWNSQLEKWTWASDTALSRKLGIDGYYMRCAPTDTLIHDGARHEALLIKNRAQDPGLKADEQL
ncbi:MAG: glycosyl hydrolase, partial [Pseudomonadota bacterium]|nr:glycosyl hydrolase [Pseudomonadota bacterium]